MFGRQAELQQEIAQLKEQVESLRQVRADFNSLAAENARLEAELVRHKSIQGRVVERMQLMAEEIDTLLRMVVNR
jgi:cell shape-determining protein MreC